MQSWVRVDRAVAVGAAGAAGVLSFLLDGDAASPWLRWFWVVPVTVVVIALSVWPTRAAGVVALIVAIASAGFCSWRSAVDLSHGTPGTLFPALAGCAVVATAALLVSLVTGPRGGPGWSIGGLLVAAGVLVVVALATESSVRHLPEIVHIAQKKDPTPIPDEVSAVGWTSEGSSGPVLSNYVDSQVVAAGTGFATILGYGGQPEHSVVGVDGPTGSVRWTYRLDGAVPRAIAATPSGRHVVVTFAPGGPTVSAKNRLVVLDAQTGERRFDRTVDSGLDGAELAPSNEVIALYTGDLSGGNPGALHGYDIVTGEERWTVSTPYGCHSRLLRRASTPDATIQVLQCHGYVQIRKIAADDGAIRWTADRPAPDHPDWNVVALADTDTVGTSVGVYLDFDGDTPSQALVLDSATGAISAELPAGTYLRSAGTGILAIAPDSAQLVLRSGVHPLGPLPQECAGGGLIASSGSGVLRTCTGTDGVEEVVSEPIGADGTPGPVTTIDVPAAPLALIPVYGGTVIAVTVDPSSRYVALH